MTSLRLENLVLLLVMVAVVTPAMQPVLASDESVNASGLLFEVDQRNGHHTTEWLSLSGRSTAPLRNTSWMLVNISSSTPTTLLSGPFLTSVEPASDDEYLWTLQLNTTGYSCTCYVRLESVPSSTDVLVAEILVYLGQEHHRPVFESEIHQVQQSGMADKAMEYLLNDPLSLDIPLIFPPLQGPGSSVSASVCEAPFGVCLSAPISHTLDHQWANNSLHLPLNATNLDLDEGIYLISLQVKDAFLRSSGTYGLILVHDVLPPTIQLRAPTNVSEFQSFMVLAEIDDGYEGASTTVTWRLVDDDGRTRAPTEDEWVSGNQLLLNYSMSGTVRIEATVRDRAGLTSSATVDVGVMNVPPIARIFIDGFEGQSESTILLGPNDNWTLDGLGSSDNEAIEYLWVIDDTTSIRGQAALTRADIPSTGLHRVELIVFDDDGSTSNTVIQIEIRDIGQEPEPSTLPLFLGVGLFILLAMLSVLIINTSSKSEGLPKWSASGRSRGDENTFNELENDATVEEEKA